jgi:hypothetical protein
MKRSILIVLSLVIFTSSCFAFEILTTGTTVGEDQFVVDGIYSTTSFNIRSVTGSIGGFGARVNYGVSKDMDVSAKYIAGSFVMSDADISQSASTLAVGAKYSFLKVSEKDPCDLAGIAELASTSSKDLTWGTNTFGISASKLMRPNLTVYGTIAILMNSSKITGAKSVSETSTLIGGGVKYVVNKKFSVLGEITRFMYDGDQYQTISLGGQFPLD